MGPLGLILKDFSFFRALGFKLRGLESFKTFDLNVFGLEFFLALGFELFRTFDS